MSMKRPNRREFLQGLGSAALYLPLLESLWLPRAYAQTATGRPLRVVFICSTNGQKQAIFYPNDSLATTQYQNQTNIRYAKLSDISGSISPVFGSSWDQIRNKVSILRGLDIISGQHDHNRGAFLASVCSKPAADSPPSFGATVDWILEQSANFYKTKPAVSALRLNPLWYEFSFSNIGGKVGTLPFLNSDSGLFNQAFASLSGSGGGGSNIPVLRGLAADKVMERIQSLEGNTRLSSFDRQRLGDQASRLAALKATYTSGPAPLACTKPGQSTASTKRRIYNNANDIIVSAFNCDLSRIACYSLEDYDDTKADYQYQHDQVSHNNAAADVAASVEMNKWKADRVADLITKLDSVIEPDGSTLLDNTLVVWGNETGASYVAHRCESMPIVIAGGKNIKFNFGYYVDYRTRPLKYYASREDFPAVGRPYNQFLVSLMLAMGLQRSEFEMYGNNGKFGEFTFGEYYNKEYDAYKTNYTDVLPFLYTGTNT